MVGLDELMKIRRQGLLYFPPIAWFYIVEKTNLTTHLIVLFVVSLLSFYCHLYISKLISKLIRQNFVGLNKSSAAGDDRKTLDHIDSIWIGRLKCGDVFAWFCLGFLLLLFISYIWSIRILLTLVIQKNAIFLFIIGIVPLLILFIFWLKQYYRKIKDKTILH